MLTNQSKFRWLAAMMVIVLLNGCSENLELEQQTPPDMPSVVYNSTETVRSNGYFLDFAYYEEFEKVRTTHNRPESFQQTARELADELGFQSMGHKYEALLKAQQSYISNLTQQVQQAELSAADAEKLPRFAPYVLANKHLVNLDEEKGSINLKVHDLDLAYLLSEDGVVLVAGALYQYTEDMVKSMPVTDPNSYDEFIKADQDNEDLNLRVSKIDIQAVDSGNDRTGPLYCQTGMSGVDNIYLEALIEHMSYVTYVYQPGVCQYDAAYYSCWYGSAAGLPYDLRVQACCPGSQVPVVNSYFYAQVQSRTSCAFLAPFCFGDEPINIAELSLWGVGSYLENGVQQSFSVSHTGYNIALNKYIIYDGPRVYDVTGSFSFTGIVNNFGLQGSGICNTTY